MMISFTRPHKTRTWYLARTRLIFSLFSIPLSTFQMATHTNTTHDKQSTRFKDDPVCVMISDETFGAKQSARRPRPHRTGSFKETEAPLAATLCKSLPREGEEPVMETSHRNYRYIVRRRPKKERNRRRRREQEREKKRRRKKFRNRSQTVVVVSNKTFFSFADTTLFFLLFRGW